MSDEELIETLRLFEEKRVEQLPESARKLFYAIMRIADDKDEYKRRLHNIEEYIKIIDNRDSYVDISEIRVIEKMARGEE